MRRPRVVAVVSLLAAIGGCGYMGDPLPPALNIPERVKDLRAVQRGADIRVSFTPSLTTTDGLILPNLAGTEVRIGPTGPPPFDTNRWADSATIVTVEQPDPTGTNIRIAVQSWIGQDVAIGVRTISPQRRFSDWSNLATLRIVEPLGTPKDLQLTPLAHAIRLKWNAGRDVDKQAWRILRRTAEAPQPVEVGRATKPEFTDSNLAYEATYLYSVQGILPTGLAEAESEISAEASLKLIDTFPPGAPVGLTAIQGVRAIELAWERNVDDDLQGYYLYRAEGDEEFVRAGALLTSPSVGDPAVTSGRRYRYRVAAVDVAGNEGPPSAIIEITAP